MTANPSQLSTVTPRVKAAIDAAAALDQPAFISVLSEEQVSGVLAARGSRAIGDSRLAGLMFAVKDNIDVLGVPTTAACPIVARPADRSAAAVERLVAAGAVPIAKTNMDQFATGLVGTRTPYGACHSIASVAHISGGSSSGSAVAVALGVVDFALGTDTAGSGRIPASFNGLVGMKPSRGLISNRGLIPASPSLDCITTFTRTVELARAAFETVIAPDAADPYSRTLPLTPPSGVARAMRVIGVPMGEIDLDEPHRVAWQQALARAASIGLLVPIDVEPFLAAGRLLYAGPMIAERLAAFGGLLEPDGPHLDPTVRELVLGARATTGADVYQALQTLAGLAALARNSFVGIDALMLPGAPGHPTLREVAREPVTVNSRLGTYTNMVNLLDLCAIAVPAGHRPDGLPFGVQLIGPTFADRPLLDLAARWCGEPVAEPSLAANRTMLAIAGAHLSGQPLNADLVDLGGRLHSRARTASGYRMFTVDGPVPRPGLVRTADGPPRGLELEIWDLSYDSLGLLLTTIAPPLGLGKIEIDDGRMITGFVANGRMSPTADITSFGSWRAYLASSQPAGKSHSVCGTSDGR